MTCERGSNGPAEPVHRFLKALASESRQQMLMLFTEGELTVGEVAARLGIGQSTASQQLAILRAGGLVTARRDGKAVHYRADTATAVEVIDALRAWVAGCCPPPDGPAEPRTGDED